VSGGEARRTGADDSNALTVSERNTPVQRRADERRHLFRVCVDWRREVLDFFEDDSRVARFRSVHLTDETLQSADGDGTVRSDELAVVVNTRDLASAACGLAGCAADAAADRGKGVRAAGYEVSIGKAALGNCSHVSAGVRMDGARHLTRNQALVVPLARNINVKRSHVGALS
jgi:hypothetical protein